jgi:ubiquinone/menaquinone biosynthesis C-methylase UbiE
MAHHVCPWWLGYFLASPLRKLFENPRTILAPWVKEGMTVLEPGPGMGFFTLELARMVGPRGKVIAVDIQPKMLDGLRRRLRRAQLSERVEVRVAQTDSLGITELNGQADLAFAFYLIHEVPDARRFFSEVREALKPGSLLVIIEPKQEVSEQQFAASLALAEEIGFVTQSRPRSSRGYSAVMVRV